MRYQQPLAYLVGLEGLALLRAWGGEHDAEFVRRRLAETAGLLADDELRHHPGVDVREGATAAAYRQWAADYDDPDNGLLELDLPFVDRALDTVGPGVAVDVGCGTGRLARRLVARGHRVLGVDASAEMLLVARRALPGTPFVTGGLTQLPVATSGADLLTCALALTHVAELGDVYREMARVLRPGGTAVITDVHPDLVRLGSAVKGEDEHGGALLARTRPHTTGQHLTAILGAGLEVTAYAELPEPDGAEPRAAPEAARYAGIGSWRQWPWTLLDRVPEAARAAWAGTPSLLAWRLRRR